MNNLLQDTPLELDIIKVGTEKKTQWHMLRADSFRKKLGSMQNTEIIEGKAQGEEFESNKQRRLP